MQQTIQVAVRSKAQVYSRFIVGIAGSNSTEIRGVRLLCLCCVGIGLCDELFTPSEQSCLVYVPNCVSARILNSEATQARFGLQRHRKKLKQYRFTNILFLDISEFTELVWIVHIFKLNFDHRSCSVVSNCTSRVVLLMNRVMINLITCHFKVFLGKTAVYFTTCFIYSYFLENSFSVFGSGVRFVSVCEFPK